MKIRNCYSKFFDERATGSKVDTLVIHSMYCPQAKNQTSARACIALLSSCEVSAHFVISRSGIVWRLVREEKRAWHAGVSMMPDGRKGVNHFSIGVELLATEKQDFTGRQYLALERLVMLLAQKFPLKSIVGHSDIARPKGRKRDPGPKFDWDLLKRRLRQYSALKKISFPSVSS